MIEIATSVLNVKEEATKCFYDLEVAGTDYFHIDVMDGRFVNNNTEEIMLDYATTLSHITSIGLDVHLMCQDIEKYVDEYIMLEPDSITFHIEVIKNHAQAMEIINDIKSNNVKVGIALNPKTDIKDVLEYLPYIHKVLVMTVEPGLGGQKLIEDTIEKIKNLKKYIEERTLDTIIEADGGINNSNIEVLVKAGLDIAVSGAYIVNAENKKDAILKLKKLEQ